MQCLGSHVQQRQDANSPTFGSESVFTPVIPEFGDAFSQSITMGGTTNQQWALFALDTLAHLPDDQLVGDEQPSDILHRYLAIWSANNTFDGSANAVLSLAAEAPPEYQQWAEETGNSTDSSFYLSMYVPYLGISLIGEAMEKIAAVNQPFAEAVMAVLENACTRTFWTVTPSELMGICSDCHWYGEMDESVLIEESCEGMTEEEISEFRENIYCKSDFDKAFPNWVLSPRVLVESDDDTPLRLSEDRVVSWEPWRSWVFEGPESGLCQRVQALCTQMVDLIKKDVRLPERVDSFCYHEATNFYQAIGWKQSSINMIGQLIDDHAQYAWESYSLEQSIIVGIDGPDGLSETLEKVSAAVALGRLVSELINVLDAENAGSGDHNQ